MTSTLSAVTLLDELERSRALLELIEASGSSS
jgi:hypothetical protein